VRVVLDWHAARTHAPGAGRYLRELTRALAERGPELDPKLDLVRLDWGRGPAADLPAEPQHSTEPEWVEVRFKANRKEYFVNASKAALYPNEWVVVEAKNGYDMGQVTLKGELVRLQMRKRKQSMTDSEVRKIFRKANESERERLRHEGGKLTA
jgi:hypothetical protein